MAAALSTAADAVAQSGPGTEGAQRVRIGTHNGTFHCDEALGCFLLRLTPQFRDAEIVRTRKQDVLDGLDAVLDVGGVYDPVKQRFDHHQRGFDHALGHGYSTKLSSAGLIYKHFGRQIVADLMGLPQEHEDVETVFLAVYKNFIEGVDAVDNGVNQYVSDSPPLYQNNTHLGARVARLNPDWLEEQTEERENAAFHKAMALAGEEFLESVRYISKSWLPARSIVAESLRNAKSVHPSGEIILLSRFCPWKQHLADLETEMQLPAPQLPKYVVYQDERGTQWRVQAVSVAPGSFASRLPLLEAWRGLRDEELSQVSGIPGCVFVHISGFIGGNQSKEGAVEMAKKSLSGQCTGQS